MPTPLLPIQTDPPPYGAPVADALPKDGETPPYRHPHFIGKDLITTFHSDPTVNTTFRCLVRAKDKWPDRLSMGTRKVLGVYHEDRKGKDWTMWELGDYEYMTFKELWEEVLVLGSSLIELGLAQCDKVGIYMQTWLAFPLNLLTVPFAHWCKSAKWFQTSLASHSQSLTIVTAYDTLGPDALAH